MPLAFYLDFATKQEGLRRFIDSKGLLSPRIGSLSCRPLPPSDNKGRDLAVIKQILHGYILSERKIRVPLLYKGAIPNAVIKDGYVYDLLIQHKGSGTMCYDMHDVLKLYFGLRAKCLWRMIKELGLMVIPALLLFSLLGTLMVLGLVYAPIYYSVLFYSFLLLACHFMRGDSTFLYSVFGVKRTKMLFSVEYMLLSFPFLCFFLHRDELWAVAIVLLPFMIAWYVPCGGFSLRLPTFPCLASGSYEYHRTGRLTMPLFLPLMAGGAIGAYIGNRNLVVAVCVIAASVISMLLMREWHVEYLFNYKSASRFLKLKLLFALRNACVIFLPIIICLILVDLSLPQLLLGALYYLGASLLLFQVEMLCFVSGGTNSGNDIISVIVYMVLNAIFCVSLIVPQAMPFSMIVSGVMAYYAYSEIKKYK